MPEDPNIARRVTAGFLMRLLRDARGNALVIMTAALIPLAGMVGGGIDLSRMYIVKTRLQHACDAGALAGRKSMGGGRWDQSNYAPRSSAERYFDANTSLAFYGATRVSRSFAESAGTVTGRADADLPMTIMRIFGRTTETLSVACSTDMRLPNTDVMFVLDTTGSMNETLSGDTQTKMTGLRAAVKCFYEIVSRENTSASCVGGDPSGGLSNDVQVRFGFVPYATNANVGRLLPSDWFVDRYTYQSREPTVIWGVWDSFADTSIRGASGWSAYSPTTLGNGISSQSNCIAPADTFTPNGNADSVGMSETDTSFVSDAPFIQTNYKATWSKGACTITERTRTGDRRSNMTKVAAGTHNAISTPAWRYAPITRDVSGLKNGSDWNASLQLPVGVNGATATVAWDGCIEERETVRADTYSPIPSGARDLDILSAPDWSDASRWAPALRNIVYTRREGISNSTAYTLAERTTFTTYTGLVYSCPSAASKLKAWTPSTFEDYVDGIAVGGNTYHDIGLIWGGRLMAPLGIFRDENQFTPRGAEIERHMIFMTDGDACTNASNYQAYGLGWFDRRQTDVNAVPTEGCGTSGTLTQQVNARTEAVCTAIRNQNITLWVIWFGEKNTSIEGRMRACASPDRFFSARNSTELQQTFRNIANQISQLRLTQ